MARTGPKASPIVPALAACTCGDGRTLESASLGELIEAARELAELLGEGVVARELRRITRRLAAAARGA